MALSPAGAWKSCCLFQTSLCRAVAAPLALHHLTTCMYMDTLMGRFFAAPQQSAALDLCCLCLKPALVLPHWDTTETECSRRCLERGLPGMQQRFFFPLNPVHVCHVHKLTAGVAGGSCIHFLCAPTA